MFLLAGVSEVLKRMIHRIRDCLIGYFSLFAKSKTLLLAGELATSMRMI